MGTDSNIILFSILDKYNIDKSQISVSGLSAGAAFATQFHVIYSSDIMGAGIIAGCEYWFIKVLEASIFESPHGKTNNLHVRKQRRRSASR